MKIGTDQYNTFDTMTMDCWNDRVYYEGKEFPAGHFAAEILNFAGAIHDPLLERIAVLTALVDDLSTAEKSKRHDIASQLKPLLRNTVSWLYKMGVLISAIVIIIYICMGGSYAHIYTNIAQGLMMTVLGVILAVSGIFIFGNVITEVPARLAEIDPNLAMGLNPNNAGYPTPIYVVGLFVAHLWWALNPQLINKATYLKNDKDVKTFCWLAPLLMFLMCSVVFVGSYTRVLVPEGIGDVITGMDGAVPYYVSLVFPKFIAAVFLVVIMAAMMSTVDGVLLYVSSILGCTLYKNTIVPARRAKGIQIDDAKVEKTTMNILKYSTFVIGLIAVPIAFNKPANLTAMLWGAAGPIMSAVAGPVVIGIFSKRPSAKAAALGSVLGCASFLILYFAKIIGSVYLCCSIGGVVSILFCVIGMYVFPPMDEKLAADAFKTLED